MPATPTKVSALVLRYYRTPDTTINGFVASSFFDFFKVTLAILFSPI
jgi:hypothetical protein